MFISKANQNIAEPIRVAVLGSTGSVGSQTLEVIKSLPERFVLTALAANHNIEKLNQQIDQYQPRIVGISTKQKIAAAKVHHVSQLFQGEKALREVATHPDIDLVVIATSGTVALPVTLAAIKAHKEVALASKEALVIGGELIMATAKKYGVELRPIDSEHCALWQCLSGEKRRGIANLILTASGGPFRDWSFKKIKQATPEQALQHPNWKMGPKVTIDSASLINKGLEVIEAHWLFNQPYEKIQTVIHRQSLIHSLVEFIDGSIKAQLAVPDMRLAIQFALTYPQRLVSQFERLDLTKIPSLTFEAPDLKRFPGLGLAYEAGKRGGTYPTVLVAADEVLVELFLKKKIRFLDIPMILEKVLEKHQATSLSLDKIEEVIQWTRGMTDQLSRKSK